MSVSQHPISQVDFNVSLRSSQLKIVYSVSQALESLLTWWNFSETTKLSDTNTKFEKIRHTLTTRPEKELKLRISPEKEHNKHPTRKNPQKEFDQK